MTSLPPEGYRGYLAQKKHLRRFQVKKAELVKSADDFEELAIGLQQQAHLNPMCFDFFFWGQ